MNVAKKVVQLLAAAGVLAIGLPVVLFIGIIAAIAINMALVALVCGGIAYVAVIAVYMGMGTLDIEEAIQILRDGPPKRDFAGGQGRRH